MSDTSNPAATLSIKADKFITGVNFRIGTEPAKEFNYRYIKEQNRIVNKEKGIIGDVFEVGAYSVKTKVEILGHSMVIYARFENIIFEEN